MSWPKAPIASIKATTPNALVGGPFGSDLTTRDYVPEGVPVIRGQNLPAGRVFDEDEFVYVSAEKAGLLRANTAGRGDLVFTQRGTLGQVGLIPATSRFERYVVSQSQMKLTVDPQKADARFVYHYFSLPVVVEEIKARAITSGVPHINLGILKELEIPLPPVEVQRKIAAIASAYDDLIENNQRRIQLLEEAARRLYREWFVALRFPGHERVQVVDGVPLGWKHRPLSESASYLNRGISPAYDDSAPGLVINQKCIRNGLLNLTPARRQAKDVPSDKRIRLGDILINSTGTGTLGRVAQVRGDLMDCTVDTHVTILRPANQEALAFWGVACLEMEPRFSEMGIGATNQQELIRAHVGAIELLVPPIDLQSDFHARAWPMLLQSEMLGKQSEILKQARDALLPRLMSGALAV